MIDDLLRDRCLHLRNSHAKQDLFGYESAYARRYRRMAMTQEDRPVRGVVVDVAVAIDILKIRSATTTETKGWVNLSAGGVDTSRYILGRAREQLPGTLYVLHSRRTTRRLTCHGINPSRRCAFAAMVDQALTRINTGLYLYSS
jgi:hypothetical protein